MARVFLGGTINQSQWRDNLIPLLNVEYFNPVITDRDWTEEDRLNELKQCEECDYVLFVVTPRMRGVYSIAEFVDNSNKRPAKTLVYIQERDVNDAGKTVKFHEQVLSSIRGAVKLAVANGATEFHSLQEIADFLNTKG